MSAGSVSSSSTHQILLYIALEGSLFVSPEEQDQTGPLEAVRPAATLLFSTWFSLAGNSDRLTWVRHSSRKSSATNSYQYAVFSCILTMVYGCRCLGFLTCAQLLMHAMAHGVCTDTVIGSALKADWEKNPLPHRGLEPASVLHFGFPVGRSANWAISRSALDGVFYRASHADRHWWSDA